MIKLLTVHITVFLILSSFSSLFFAQTDEDIRNIWSIPQIDTDPSVNELPKIDWLPAEQVERFYDFATGITVGPNFRVLPSSSSTQSELSVDVHPSNDQRDHDHFSGPGAPAVDERKGKTYIGSAAHLPGKLHRYRDWQRFDRVFLWLTGCGDCDPHESKNHCTLVGDHPQRHQWDPIRSPLGSFDRPLV